MKLFSAAQIKQWDAYTIANEPISSIALMERAAAACYHWLMNRYGHQKDYFIFCGTGNNGGDGLAIAQMLYNANIKTAVSVVGEAENGSEDFKINLEKIKQTGIPLNFIQEGLIPIPHAETVIIDAIFGTGLSRAVSGYHQSIIEQVNACTNEIVSIDMPSGMFADSSSKNNIVIEATHTLSFQCNKTAFMMQENARFTGDVTILDIGLHNEFYKQETSNYDLMEINQIRDIYKPRNRFSHKGNFGHAMIIGGSKGKIGATILAAAACLRSGAGLVTVSIPEKENPIMQVALPEAMTITEPLSEEILEKFTALGIGPGWGIAKETQELLRLIIKHYKKPLVLDADGLNCLSLNRSWLKKLPENSILTPHPKEFERLFGKSDNDFDRLDLAKRMATLHKLIIVLKGHHTAIVLPGGNCYFNSTGNAGMARGGSGDVLTGILTALLAQGYSPEKAAIMGVYLHGSAGDIAAKANSQEAMLAGDIIGSLGKAFTALISSD